MEFFPTFDMIRGYFMKALQGSQFRRFVNIILGIYEYDIPSYNVHIISLLEELKINIEREKKRAHKANKLAGG